LGRVPIPRKEISDSESESWYQKTWDSKDVTKKEKEEKKKKEKKRKNLDNWKRQKRGLSDTD
jgi:hypothetical protein